MVVHGEGGAAEDDQGVEIMNGDVESVRERLDVGDRTGRVSRPVLDARESSSAVRRERDGTLRLGRTPVRPRCCDRGAVEVDTGAPVPPSDPGEFVVHLGADDVPDRLDRGLASLLLTWIQWAEVEVQGFEDLVERLRLLRGAVMSVAAAVAGEL